MKSHLVAEELFHADPQTDESNDRHKNANTPITQFIVRFK
jgi:hypothetical protein